MRGSWQCSCATQVQCSIQLDKHARFKHGYTSYASTRLVTGLGSATEVQGIDHSAEWLPTTGCARLSTWARARSTPWHFHSVTDWMSCCSMAFIRLCCYMQAQVILETASQVEMSQVECKHSGQQRQATAVRGDTVQVRSAAIIATFPSSVTLEYTARHMQLRAAYCCYVRWG